MMLFVLYFFFIIIWYFVIECINDGYINIFKVLIYEILKIFCMKSIFFIFGLELVCIELSYMYM